MVEEVSDTAPLSAPGPLQIIVAKEDHSFELNEEALGQILLRDDVRNKKVVVVSVAGAFRKGKSFLLDFFLRYMNFSPTGDVSGTEWMGSDDAHLEGFHWRGGTDRDTMGVLMWSEPFFRTLPTGEEVVVLIVDTQGAFDNQSTVKDCATVFAMSTMVSSVQVYNLSQMIHENDLQHLQLFTEYGRLAMEEGDSTPFQGLHFLLRDWSYGYEYENGREGGEKYLATTLEIKDTQHEQLRSVREHIRACFEEVSCFLMPHPGLKVATQRDFKGCLSDIDEEFKVQLNSLVPQLLAPENLVIKKINGSKVTGSGLLEYFRAYMKIYNGEDLPEPKSMLEATAEANNMTAVNTAMEMYRNGMKEICGPEKPFMAPTDLEEAHDQQREKALNVFRTTKKMGSKKFTDEYEEKLSVQIEEAYTQFVAGNNNKNVFNAARTPATLVVLLIVTHLMGYIFETFYLFQLDQFVDYIWWISAIMIIAWSYVRYSGQYRDIGAWVDGFALLVWEQFLCEIYAAVAQRIFGAQLPWVQALIKKKDQ
ncbi:atlastin-1-like [Sycon ciliatum]|uniref:atlastin-1-like n=1 Tax=Sycon ciliatum TaxID=27933 RepID=UPI0020A86825|eukprot:scpid53187/ scgid31113/ Atlastin-1